MIVVLVVLIVVMTMVILYFMYVRPNAFKGGFKMVDEKHIEVQHKAYIISEALMNNKELADEPYLSCKVIYDGLKYAMIEPNEYIYGVCEAVCMLKELRYVSVQSIVRYVSYANDVLELTVQTKTNDEMTLKVYKNNDELFNSLCEVLNIIYKNPTLAQFFPEVILGAHQFRYNDSNDSNDSNDFDNFWVWHEAYEAFTTFKDELMVKKIERIIDCVNEEHKYNLHYVNWKWYDLCKTKSGRLVVNHYNMRNYFVSMRNERLSNYNDVYDNELSARPLYEELSVKLMIYDALSEFNSDDEVKNYFKGESEKIYQFLDKEIQLDIDKEQLILSSIDDKQLSTLSAYEAMYEIERGDGYINGYDKIPEDAIAMYKIIWKRIYNEKNENMLRYRFALMDFLFVSSVSLNLDIITMTYWGNNRLVITARDDTNNVKTYILMMNLFNTRTEYGDQVNNWGKFIGNEALKAYIPNVVSSSLDSKYHHMLTNSSNSCYAYDWFLCDADSMLNVSRLKESMDEYFVKLMNQTDIFNVWLETICSYIKDAWNMLGTYCLNWTRYDVLPWNDGRFKILNFNMFNKGTYTHNYYPEHHEPSLSELRMIVPDINRGYEIFKIKKMILGIMISTKVASNGLNDNELIKHCEIIDKVLKSLSNESGLSQLCRALFMEDTYNKYFVPCIELYKRRINRCRTANEVDMMSD